MNNTYKENTSSYNGINIKSQPIEENEDCFDIIPSEQLDEHTPQKFHTLKILSPDTNINDLSTLGRQDQAQFVNDENEDDLNLENFPDMSAIKEIYKESIPTIIKLTNPRILLCDDNPFNRMVSKHILGKENAEEIVEAENGLDALEKYKAHLRGNKSFDIISMDIQMPKMDGRDALVAIREYEKEHNLKPCLLYIASACGCRDTKKFCLSNEADDYLDLPIHVDLLCKVLEKGIKNGKLKYKY